MVEYGKYRMEQAVYGEAAEVRCANDLIRQYGGSYRRATLSENKYEHKDIIYTHPKRVGREYSFDVKMIKKVRRFFKDYTDKYHWVEFHGGYPKAEGWINGKQDWIAFETYDEWLFVNREKLKERISEIMKGKDGDGIKMTNECNAESLLYKWYKHNDFDKIVLVETDLLREICQFRVKKTE